MGGIPATGSALLLKEAHKEWLDAFNDQDINQRSTCCSSASDAWSAPSGRRKKADGELRLCHRCRGTDESNDGATADLKGFRQVTGADIPAGIDLDFLVDVAHRPQAEIQRTCSHRYQTFASLLRGASSSIQAMERGLGLCRNCDDFLVLERSAFAPVNKAAAKKKQLFCVLRQPSRPRTQPLL